MSIKKYGLIAPNINEWIFITEIHNYKIIWSNLMGTKILGFKLSKIIGKSCCELVHGRQRPLFKCPQKSFNNNTTNKRIEFRCSGKKQKYLEIILPLFNSQIKKEYLIHIIYPIVNKNTGRRNIKKLDRLNKIIIKKTMLIAQKNEHLKSIKSQLSLLENMNGNEKIVRNIIEEIKAAFKSDKNWKEFSLRFENIHIGFYQYLLKFSLTSGQIRICAFLCLNLNTKDIASLLCVSIRGVEQSRYRIRKKLGLKKGQNLNSFLISNLNNMKY